MPRSTSDWTGLRVSQGRYRVRARLGAGGMAIVYRAHDTNLDADVVLKVPRRSILDDPDFAARFAREVRSLVKLSHPNIVKITDVGEHDGFPFAVMQYLSGGSLEDYASSNRSDASVRAALAALDDWLPAVARALDFVHSQGYVHRDVKPGNILFDAHGHAFLGDFGVAKVVAAGHDAPPGHAPTAMTAAGLVCGTAAYMAPELIMDGPIDGRVDQYALAVTVFQMLSGRLPFEASSPSACMVMQTTQEPPPLAQVEPRVPRGDSEAVARALSKDPARRFASCSAFAAEVIKGARGSSVEPARRPQRPDQVRLECPSCGKVLVFPASLMSDKDRARAKTFACGSCRAHLRVSEAGVLYVADGSGTVFTGPREGAETIVSSPPRAGEPTRKMTPPREATVRVARPAEPTMAQARPPEPTPTSAVKHGPGVAAIVAASLLGFAMVAGAAGLAVFAFLPGPPRPGRVHIDIEAVPRGAIFALDGQPIEPSALVRPLEMHPGSHELVVMHDGFVPFRRVFPVSAGDDSGFTVVMTREPPPPEPLEPGRKVAAEEPTPEPEPEPEPPLSPGPTIARAPHPPRPHLPAAARPTMATGAFRPVPDGPPVEKETLESLLQDPNAFANRIVVPVGLYLLGPIEMGHPDGSATTTAARIALHVRTPNLAHLEPVEPPAKVLIDPELAEHLRSLADVRYPPSRTRLNGRWHETAAVLTFHVATRMEGDGAGQGKDDAVPILKKVEFLVGMNFYRVGEGNFKDSFQTTTVTTASAPHTGPSDRHDWSARLSARYISQLKAMVRAAKDNRFYHNMQMINNAMMQRR